MRGKNYLNVIKKTLFLILLMALFFPNSNSSLAYNKPWDQGHVCCEPKKGSGNWGKYDYEGVFHGGFTSKECCELLCKICSVYARTGELQKTFTDLTVPGVGPSLTITRTYLSQDWASSLLGHGWVFNFGKKLIVTRNKKGEKILGIRQETGEKNFFKEHDDGTLELLAEYGVTYDLIKNPDGTYTIKDKYGSQYELNEDGKISKIIDKNGNKLTFEYNSVGCLSKITNESGNYVEFQLGPNGKIASISDNLGRTVSYGYDENGNLTSFTDPMGYTTQYVYDSENRLIQIIDPRGNTVLTVTYDNNQPPRVATFTEKGETWTVAYYSDHTVKRDSQGNTWTYYFNNLGIIEKVIDPLGNVVSRHHNKVTSTSVDWEEGLNGNRTTYTWDAEGNITSVQDPLGNTRTYTYDPNFNKIATETDELGRTTKYEYDSNGNVIKEYYAYGTPSQTEKSYTYDSNGNRTSRTDELGNTWTYTYDAMGNVLTETDPLGNTKTYTYDKFGNVLTITDEKGNTTSYGYDLMGRKVKEIDPAGNETIYSYDPVGNLTSETRPDGSTWSFEYDQYNRLIRIIDPLGGTITRTYDSDGNVLSEIDQNGKVTYYEYNSLGRLIKVIKKVNDTQPNEDSDDVVWRYGYDAAGNLTSVTNPLGHTTSFTYDALRRKTSQTNPDGTQVTYTYDAVGNLLTESFPNGNVISYEYDSHNRVIKISDTIGTVSTISYDKAGRVISRTDGNGNTTYYSYDALGRLIEVTDPTGEKVQYTYDSVGNRISTTDREGHITQYSYDSLGRLTAETGPLGHQTTFEYDNMGNLISITDANGNKTSFEYDALGRLTREISADGMAAEFTYDAVGNLTSKTDRDGNFIRYIYDDLYRVIKIDYPGSNDATYTYNKLGMILTGSNEIATISMAYDSMQRLIQFVQDIYTTDYDYDIANNQITISRPSGRDIIFHLDKRGRLARVEEGTLGNLINYTYDNGDRVVKKTYSNGIEAAYSYNPNSLITDLVYSKNGSTILGYHYVLDKEGNRLLAKHLQNNSQSEEYGYDGSYRLINFKRGTPTNDHIPSPITQSSWQLDPVSNWIQKTKDGTVMSFASNNVNEYTQVNGSQYLYDNRGNLLDDGTYLYSYDCENRLIEIKDKSTGETIAKYSYGPFGRRIKKEINGAIIKYIYCQGNVIEEYKDGVLEKEYINGSGTADKVTFSNGNSYFYSGNSLGSVIGITDASGNVIETYQYSAYGEPLIFNSAGSQISTSLIGNPYMFAGMRYDEEGGLYHTQYRQYSSKIGRFLSRDPVRSINPYVYAESNPINLVDPLGLWVKVPGKKDIWMAEKDGDKLETLATTVGGSSKDWVCLWPVEMRNPGGYPSVMKCDEFDVSNLTIMNGPDLDIDLRKNYPQSFFGSWPNYSNSSPTVIYTAISVISGQGATPIKRLRVHGHGCASCSCLYNEAQRRVFCRSKLESYANFAKTPTYVRAKSKKGPLRCWFAKNAHVWLLACSSGYTAAPDFAKILRSGAVASGTNAPGRWHPTDPYYQIGSGKKHYSWSSLITDPGWIHTKGKN